MNTAQHDQGHADVHRTVQSQNDVQAAPQAARQPERPRPMSAPRVDVYESKDAFIAVADVPGVSESSVDITLEKDQLTIEGRVEAPARSESQRLRIAESVHGGFQRTFAVPDGIDRERISATVKNGVLTLVLPKSEAVRPRKISVQPSAA